MIPSVWTDFWSELGHRIKGGLVGDEMTAPGNPGGILRLILDPTQVNGPETPPLKIFIHR